MWGMDLLELPESTTGNKYLLVMTEYLTRWVEAVPIANKEATTIASVVHREIFCRYGAPTSILSDKGGESDNQLLLTLCKSDGVKRLILLRRRAPLMD